MDKMLEKFEGSILGLSIGDALGMPTEWFTKEEIAEKYGLIDNFVDPKNKFNGILKAGQYTDDTDQTIAILNSFDVRGFNNDIFIKELIKWYNNNPVGIGPTSTKAIEKLIEGDTTGCDSRTCGSSMRVGPLGLFYFGEYDKLKEITIKATKLTHNNDEAIAGALSIAFFVAESVNHVKSEKSIKRCAKFIEDVSYDFSEKILLINDLNSADEAYNLFNTGLPAIECVPSAIATFLRTDTFKDGMISCVNAGGDTDSMGSMYGAIAGAYYGVSNIPEIWIAGLQNKDLLVDLSKKLYKLRFKK
ncbi:ADP-ribosylglycohydrolase family protein [Methanococcus maripaludis]|uniref:Putative ADP-ribosylglycohydrolase n=1 Tax=Methanococcus maripaludis OS7 TaxID=637915 RepID=A0A2Z5PIJ7_METMI|nr:ADP-ribosylglycohydrolase family protein [Methanococcus maripaludis]BAP62753.1 putative ADP-ribosylglycohydrolase [Methanococcus maripaludis OS7]